MTKIKEPCPECGASGEKLEAKFEPVCCGRFTENGICCGQEIGMQVHSKCNECHGTGLKTTDYHDEE